MLSTEVSMLLFAVAIALIFTSLFAVISVVSSIRVKGASSDLESLSVCKGYLYNTYTPLPQFYWASQMVLAYGCKGGGRCFIAKRILENAVSVCADVNRVKFLKSQIKTLINHSYL